MITWVDTLTYPYSNKIGTLADTGVVNNIVPTAVNPEFQSTRTLRSHKMVVLDNTHTPASTTKYDGWIYFFEE